MTPPDKPSEPPNVTLRPTLGTAVTWIVLAGAFSGGLGVLTLFVARRFGPSGLGLNLGIVLVGMLVAGLIAGPWQRHQLGGSLAAAVSFGFPLVSSYFLGYPIDMHRALGFQVQFLSGLGLLAALLIGAAAASPWTSRLKQQSK